MSDDELRLSRNTRYVVIVDLHHAHLYVLENRGAGSHVLQRCYALIAEDGFGKVSRGDQRTPVNIFMSPPTRSALTPASTTSRLISAISICSAIPATAIWCWPSLPRTTAAATTTSRSHASSSTGTATATVAGASCSKPVSERPCKFPADAAHTARTSCKKSPCAA